MSEMVERVWLLIGAAIFSAASFEYAYRLTRSGRHAILPDWLSLRDAAQIIFDETQRNWITQKEAELLPENPLLPTARTIIAVAPKVYGKRLGASRYDEIPLPERKSMNVSTDMNCAGKPALVPQWRDIRLRRKDVKAALRVIRQQNQVYE